MKLYPIYENIITSNDEYKIDSYMNGTISEAEFFNSLEQLHELISWVKQLINLKVILTT